MSRVAGVVLGVMVTLLLGGCGAGGPLAAFRATPTPTTTPTATPSPSPTATPTATPTPTPLPPAIEVGWDPTEPRQGDTVRLRLRLDRAASVEGLFDGRPLTFFYDSPLEPWAWIAVVPWSELGPRPLLIEARAPEGDAARLQLAVPVAERLFETQNIDVPASQDDLLAAGLRPAEDLYLGDRLQGVGATPLWSGPFTVPANGFWTSPFGARRSYQGGPLTGYHGGLDIAAPEGSEVVAAAAGIVVVAEPLFVRGNVVAIDHGTTVHTLYFHLSSVEVTPGQRVEQGQLIGRMGTTGLSTGSHLHWEVRLAELIVDPEPWLAQDPLAR